jgi:hydroxymethylglutaryl-CoA lyase
MSDPEDVYAGLEPGVRSFEGALAGLGGCPWAPGAPGRTGAQLGQMVKR